MPRLRIDVVYASAGGEDRRRVELSEGAVAADAVAASGLPAGEGLPEGWALGVAGRAVRADHALKDGDRVDILRPLAMDPREARRRRARRGRRS